MRVGIIGFGTIGEDVALAITNGEAGNVELTAVLVRDRLKVKQPDSYSFLITEREEEFFHQPLDLVIEAAGHNAVRKYSERILHNGADLIIVSVGAFADEDLLQRVKQAAEEEKRKVIIPSASIGGLDRIAAGSIGPMEEVTLITRKPPKSWFGTIIEQQVDLNTLTEPYCAFEGVARDSARLFPENINVSAALSLAGVGFDQTKVKVIVDPSLTSNTHEIEAKGKFGQIHLQVKNTPTERNSKTGYIVAMSITKTLRNLTTSFVVGI